MASAPSPCCVVEYHDQPMCCDLSPDSALMAVGLITGDVHIHTYTYTAGQPAADVSSQPQRRLTPHEAEHSCRAVRWLPGSRQVVSGSADKCLVASSVETGKRTWQVQGAHDGGVSMLRVMPRIQEHGLIASGDEDGGLKVWDLRTQKQAMSFKKHKDFISDIRLHERDTALVVSSGDGTLSVHDLRTLKFRARSEADADDDMLSLAIVKNGKKVVAGCGSGVLAIYSWGYFNDCSDRFPGHPESVDALVVWDDTTVLTGSSDGLVRAINILPNKLLGVIGAHEEMPIEHLELSYDRRVLASTSHDNSVRLWDLAILQDDNEEEGEGEGEESEGEWEEGGEAVMQEAGIDDNQSNDEGEGEQAAYDEGDDEGKEGEAKCKVQGVPDEQGEEGKEDGSTSGGEVSEPECEEVNRQNLTSGIEQMKAKAKVVGELKKGGKRSASAVAGGSEGPSKKDKVDGNAVQGLGQAQKASQDKSKGGLKRLGKVITPAPVGSDSDSDDGSDEDEGKGAKGRKKGKRHRGEKTRWTKQTNKKPVNDFFAGLM